MSDRPSYFYLLGQYLGDGDIALIRRGVFRMRIACTWDYPEILVEVAEAMASVSQRESVSIIEAKGHSQAYVSWKHWPCAFPQHGRGKKHQRRTALEPWQQPSSESDHQWLLRGLIHSDGCRFINPIERRLQNGVKRYEYVRYVFTNWSQDIQDLFTASLDSLEIDWRVMTERTISIARRRSVEKLDTFVGPKR